MTNWIGKKVKILRTDDGAVIHGEWIGKVVDASQRGFVVELEFGVTVIAKPEDVELCPDA